MVELSVIIPTFNRQLQLQQVLAGLGRQTFPVDRFEVLVVSDGSTDGTNEYLATLSAPFTLRAIVQKNQGPAVARNRGIAEARGFWVLFLDDDVVPVSRLLDEHIAILSQDVQSVVLGPMLLPPGAELDPWVVWEARALEKQYQAMQEKRWGATARQFYTGNTSLARQHLIAVGGFDPTFHRAEDVELAYRLHDLGLKFIFVPEAVGYHYARRSFRSWFDIAYAYGRYDVVIAHQKGRPWLLKTILREFKQRSLLVRGLVQLCLGREVLSRQIMRGLKWIADLGAKLKLELMAQLAYSGIFNLRYYQGIADALGGAKAFWSAIVQETMRGTP